LTVQWDIWLVRKLGVPGNEELAMGAVAPGGVRVLNEDILSHVPNARDALEIVVERESAELARRETLYRQGRPFPSLKDKLIILTDDGLATGATMRAAVKALQYFGVRHCLVAVPVGTKEACALLRTVADEVICLEVPHPFYGVGHFYADFAQVTDEEVLDLLTPAKLR
jgi:predicted phosphoribosyltransferase